MENKELVRRVDRGGSLPVENAQALASNTLNEIPPRYIRTEDELGQICDEDKLQIPVIDMSKLFDHDDELERLHLACKDWQPKPDQNLYLLVTFFIIKLSFDLYISPIIYWQ